CPPPPSPPTNSDGGSGCTTTAWAATTPRTSTARCGSAPPTSACCWPRPGATCPPADRTSCAAWWTTACAPATSPTVCPTSTRWWRPTPARAREVSDDGGNDHRRARAALDPRPAEAPGAGPGHVVPRGRRAASRHHARRRRGGTRSGDPAGQAGRDRHRLGADGGRLAGRDGVRDPRRRRRDHGPQRDPGPVVPPVEHRLRGAPDAGGPA